MFVWTSAVTIAIAAAVTVAGAGSGWTAGNGAELVIELTQHIERLLRRTGAAVFQLLNELLADRF